VKPEIFLAAQVHELQAIALLLRENKLIEAHERTVRMAKETQDYLNFWKARQ
jgi:hypothetical protein